MTHPAEAKNFDEIEAGLDAGDKPNVLETKLVGDDLPDDVKDKTVKDILERNKKLQELLQASETDRQSTKDQMAALEAKVDSITVRPGEQLKPEDDTFDDDAFREEYEKDQAGALLKLQRYQAEQTEKRLTGNLEKRLTPLVVGAGESAESAARQRHAEVFEVLGSEIATFITTALKGDKSMLATPKAWDDLVSYIRGQPANFEKIVEHRSKKPDPAAAARAAAEAATPANLTAAVQRTPTQQSGDLDPLAKEIAEGLGLSEADYKKWSKVS